MENSSSSSESVIDVKNLYKIFGPDPQQAFPLLEDGKSKAEILDETGCTVAVNDANFSIRRGETFVIMGLSGSGKSTVLRCLNRLVEPTRGSVRIDGDDITEMSSKELTKLCQEKVSMVFQHFGLLPHRDVKSNVAFGLEVRGVSKEERRERAHNAIDLVGLSGYEDKNPDALSGGMQQRVGLARALANDPDILLMDEPFSALDPLIRTDMQNELISLQAEMQKTVLFVTHDLDEALKIGDRIAIMKDGAVVQIGTPEEILTDPADEYVRSFVQNVDRTRVIKASTLMREYPTVTLPSDPSEKASHGPAVAIRSMKKEGTQHVYVVDDEQRLQGVVHLDDAVDLRAKGESDLRTVLDEDVSTTHADTAVAMLLPQVFESDDPIAVLDDEGRLQGIVDRASILSVVTTNIEHLQDDEEPVDADIDIPEEDPEPATQ